MSTRSTTTLFYAPVSRVTSSTRSTTTLFYRRISRVTSLTRSTAILFIPAFLGLLRLLVVVECCFTSTETVGLLGTGAQDVHLDFHTAPEL